MTSVCISSTACYQTNTDIVFWYDLDVEIEGKKGKLAKGRSKFIIEEKMIKRVSTRWTFVSLKSNGILGKSRSEDNERWEEQEIGEACNWRADDREVEEIDLNNMIFAKVKHSLDTGW